MSSQITSRISLTHSKAASQSEFSPCILPCHIKYSGPAPVSDFFAPSLIDSDSANETWEAYFRGRRLIGKAIDVPRAYRAVVYDTSKPPAVRVVIDQARAPPSHNKQGGQDELDEDEVEEVTEWTEKTRFNRLLVFGNGGPVDEERDATVKGIREWIDLANVIHGQ